MKERLLIGQVIARTRSRPVRPQGAAGIEEGEIILVRPRAEAFPDAPALQMGL